MDERLKKELVRLGAGDIEFHVPMAAHTSFRVGGCAEALFEAKGVKALQRMIAHMTGEGVPYTVIGKGSNLLVGDEGIEGVVIRLRGVMEDMEGGGLENGLIRAGGGMPLSELVGECGKTGLAGVEFLAGIPGTVGGAVAMNAGAWGQEMEGIVRGIEMINRLGEQIFMDRGDLDFSYRSLALPPGGVIIRATLLLRHDSPQAVSRRASDYLKRRKAQQPLAFPSGGSIFKNPPNAYAGRLIEEAGLKGKRVGGAMISEQHANFIVNTGNAKAADILALMKLAKERVREKTGISLDPEIRVVGL
jgi:UDP-N-acetylmuramate dehydrogenase